MTQCRCLAPWLLPPLLVAALLPLAAVAVVAQGLGPAAEYAVKAQFLERFTRFVTWPDGALPEEPGSPFVLGVVGRDPFGEALGDIARQHDVGGRPIELRQVRLPAEIGRCHMLFVSRSESQRLDEVLAATRRRPILTVGDTPGYARRGVIVNLFVEGGKVGFEVNERAARDSGLALSSKLLKLARPVEGEE